MEVALRCGLPRSVPSQGLCSVARVSNTVYPLLQPNDMNTIFRPFHRNRDLPRYVCTLHPKYSESELTVYHGVDTKRLGT